MQEHPSQRAAIAHPDPDSPEHRVQRWVLLELVTSPPAEGDLIDALGPALNESTIDVEAAVKALVDVGLAAHHEERVRATVAALRFDALWPIAVGPSDRR